MTTTSPLTTQELDELEGLEKVATVSGWVANGELVVTEIGAVYPRVANTYSPNNAAFIAAIRNAAPRLLQHVRDQQAIEMGCPSPEDIAEWLKFVNGMILIAVVHVGESEPIPRLVAVSDWLERLAARAKEE